MMKKIGTSVPINGLSFSSISSGYISAPNMAQGGFSGHGPVASSYSATPRASTYDQNFATTGATMATNYGYARPSVGVSLFNFILITLLILFFCFYRLPIRHQHFMSNSYPFNLIHFFFFFHAYLAFSIFFSGSCCCCLSH